MLGQRQSGHGTILVVLSVKLIVSFIALIHIARILQHTQNERALHIATFTYLPVSATLGFGDAI